MPGRDEPPPKKKPTRAPVGFLHPSKPQPGRVAAAQPGWVPPGAVAMSLCHRRSYFLWGFAVQSPSNNDGAERRGGSVSGWGQTRRAAGPWEQPCSPTGSLGRGDVHRGPSVPPSHAADTPRDTQHGSETPNTSTSHPFVSPPCPHTSPAPPRCRSESSPSAGVGTGGVCVTLTTPRRCHPKATRPDTGSLRPKRGREWGREDSRWQRREGGRRRCRRCRGACC